MTEAAKATEVMVFRMEQYRPPQMAVVKCGGILSTYTNMVYEMVNHFCCITVQFIHTNNEGNNLMYLLIEILVK